MLFVGDGKSDGRKVGLVCDVTQAATKQASSSIWAKTLTDMTVFACTGIATYGLLTEVLGLNIT